MLNSMSKVDSNQLHPPNNNNIKHVTKPSPSSTTINSTRKSITTKSPNTINNTVSNMKRHLCICLVSDFFYPGFGGVETHMYSLAQCLIRRGHRVIVVTRAYPPRYRGVRYLTGGLKVYYLPMAAVTLDPGNVTLPTFHFSFPLIRNIYLREEVSLVHGHQAPSTLCHEAILHARTMGIKAAFTDHSLFGFADAACIHINKVLKWTLSDVDHVICVSHTSKENTVLRAAISPHKVHVVPNAVDTTVFRPRPRRRGDRLTIVVLTRLVYRKGVDLLADVIPRVCQLFPQVDFVVGGDGPRRIQMEEAIEKHQLEDRVRMVGAVPHHKTRDLIIQGDIFLNTSLTEAFCIAILEAASCGLFSVSTNVGGVPEVLPRSMIVLADTRADSIVAGVGEAVRRVRRVDPTAFHRQVSAMYSWDDVAARTEDVYLTMVEEENPSLLERLRRYYSAGQLYGKVLCVICILDYLMLWILALVYPDDTVERAVSHPPGPRDEGNRRNRRCSSAGETSDST
eukprot:gb/GECH01009810.1/.p1 GENE.gb/GECH01009810.1/~~gb/GECH01009810.1/.p1  ORF type:complete len:510 (+),score=78.89 gb/GECH01009810.1/:1-1530(+)